MGDVADILDEDRHVVVDLDDRLLDVFDLLDETEATDDVLDPVDLNRPRTDIDIGCLDRSNDLVQTDAVGAHRIRIDVDLVFAGEPADGGDLADALGAGESVADVPVLDAAEFVKVPPAGGMAVTVPTLQRVPEYLPEAGRVGPEGGPDSFRQGPAGKTVELLEHPAATPVEVHILLEDHVDAREAKERVAADGLDTGNAQQGNRQRIGDLVLHVLWGPPHPLGEHDLLVLPDVGNGIDRHRGSGQAAHVPVERSNADAPSDNQHDREGNNQLVLETESNDPVQDPNCPALIGVPVRRVHESRSLPASVISETAAVWRRTARGPPGICPSSPGSRSRPSCPRTLRRDSC